MRNTFILFILFFTSINIFSQTLATTEKGKKVVINDDGTWYYAQQSEVYLLNNTSCLKKRTGSVSFENKTDRDLYLYFGSWYKKKINPGEIILINDVQEPGYFGIKESIEYKILDNWAPSYLDHNQIKNYLENGNVYILPCKTIKIVIQDI